MKISMNSQTTVRYPALNRSRILFGAGATFGVLLLALFAALALGGPTKPKPMQSISDPFKGVDFSGLQPLSHYVARDGAKLAYRLYVPAGKIASHGSVVLVHGSSANSQSLHPLAQSFAAAGFTAYALDIRGHGDSGTQGEIAYIGQLDDDLADFMQSIPAVHPTTLVGFSAGGGFAIRVAGGSRQEMFDNYLFLAPYTSRFAANYRPNAGGWLSVGIPRMVALTLLNRVGLSGLNYLPVVDFAVADTVAARAAQLTPWYSYALSKNFQPPEDYQASIRNIRRPAAVLDGQDDEVFIADKFAQVFAVAGRSDIPVTLVPGAGHISLTVTPTARAAAVSAVEKLDAVMR
jgi:alpha-beta hydrolase superfamily lysophospholipase